MTDPAAPAVTLSRRDPSGMGREAARLVPQGAACAVLDWPLGEVPDEADTALHPAIVDALCSALLATGRLAARWDDDPPCDPRIRLVAAPRLSWLGWPRRRLWPLEADAAFAVVVTDEAAVARRLFAPANWNWGACQAVLAFDPAADEGTVIASLQRGLDWRGRPLPPGARLLFGPGHDADFAVVAARDEAILERFETAVTIGPARDTRL